MDIFRKQKTTLREYAATLPRFWLSSALAAAMLVTALVLITYLDVWHFTFLDYDDDIHLVNNPYLLRGDIAAFWRMPYYGLYIPVVYTVWTLISLMSEGPSAPIMHLVNLLFHLGNGLILYRIIRHLLLPAVHADQGTAAPASSNDAGSMACLLATLLFLLHPLQVEPVAWASGLRDLMGAFFTLCAFLLALPPVASWAAFACFILAILAKPTSCFLPLALGFFYLWHYRWKPMATLRALSLWFLAAGLLVLLEKSVQMESFDPAIAQLPLWHRLYVAADALGFYLIKMFWPWPLATDYGRLPATLPRDAPVMALLAVAVTLLIWLWRKYLTTISRSALLFAALALLAVSGIVPFAHQQISTVADRYAYLPLAGLAIALAPLLLRYRRRGVILTATLLIILLAALSHHRLAIWQDNQSFFTDMLQHNPASFNARIGLGVAALSQKEPTTALIHFEQALLLKPRNVTALANLGLALFALGRYGEVLQRVEPWLPDQKFIATVPLSTREIAVMYLAVGGAKLQLGYPQEAYQRICAASRIDPQNSSATALQSSIAATLRVLLGGAEPVCLP